ncbi:hypothetical protein C8Q74DRAFT_777627 [Fomes fomentarius]|nr:hypothetical protein C8Q74DRAFT_777627 [Fomes fomentarius]
MGQDQTEPRNIAPRDAREARAIRKLLKSRSVKRVANFASSCLQIYAPSLHNYYGHTLDELCSHGDTVHRNFKGNVFAGASFNLGPQTVTTAPHRDHLHLPFGLSAVTVFGDFDPKKSAKLKLLIQVPPYTTYMIMSAIITHSHTPLAEGDTRLSFSQYFAGALFRYRRRDSMCTQKQFEREGNGLEPGAERWSKGIRLLRSWATRW